MCITIGHDSAWAIWRVANGEKLLQLPVPSALQSNKADQFRPKFVRFTRLGRANYVFVAVFVPLTRGTKNQRSFVSLWSYNATHNTCANLVTAPAVAEVASALCTAGDFTAVGTLSGSVAVFDTHSMRRLYLAAQSHDIFVTAVALLAPTAPPDQQLPRIPLVAGTDFAAICYSVSADQTVQMHGVRHEDGASITAYCVWLSVMASALYLLRVVCGL